MEKLKRAEFLANEWDEALPGVGVFFFGMLTELLKALGLTVEIKNFIHETERRSSAKTKIIRQVHFGRQVRQEASGSVRKCQEQPFPSGRVRSGI